MTITSWQRLGCLLTPDAEIPWLVSHTGACSTKPTSDPDRLDLYVTGRDTQNRSRIGRATLDLTDGMPSVPEVDRRPVLSLGELGAFDDNGTSYPCIVASGQETRMYYTGWTPSVTVSFNNQLGLAVSNSSGDFERYTRAPILARTDSDYSSIGSAFVMKEDKWRMWYTAFVSWDSPSHHRYHIKYAESEDGLNWHRDNVVAIPSEHEDEHSICRPTVIKREETYHMYYCTRGDHYRLGYATSKDGVQWKRLDDQISFAGERGEWERSSQCYPWLLEHHSGLYLLYCGSDYGAKGLGIARLVE